ncbi:MAG: heme-binding domain-containing protein [Acidimicrobiia bacterium]
MSKPTSTTRDQSDAASTLTANHPAKRSWRGPLLKTALVGAGLFVIAQLVPYRIDNPKVVAEPAWDASTRDLVVRACYDCHSNETKKPWYSYVAPLSWYTANHVKEGRSQLNFSEWTANSRKLKEAIETIDEGSMPPNYYTWFGLHSDAKLTDAEKAQLIAGLRAIATNASTAS